MRNEHGLYEIGLDNIGGKRKEGVRFLIQMPHEEAFPVFPDSCEGCSLATYVDVETTGLDPKVNEMIQFGFVNFWFDDKTFEIVGIKDSGYLYRKPTKGPVPEEVTRLTGLTDAILGDSEFNGRDIKAILDKSEFVVAHNAKFDRSFIDEMDDTPRIWGCTNVDLGLRDKLHIPSNSLGVLLAYLKGYYFGHHDALEDCWAGVHLLSFENNLEVLIKEIFRETHDVYAHGSEFRSKDALKLRGYKWDADAGVWFRQAVSSDDVEAELAWVKENAGGQPKSVPVSVYERCIR